MVKIIFSNGVPNESIEIGDLVYYVDNPNTNYLASTFPILLEILFLNNLI